MVRFVRFVVNRSEGNAVVEVATQHIVSLELATKGFGHTQTTTLVRLTTGAVTVVGDVEETRKRILAADSPATPGGQRPGAPRPAVLPEP